MKNIIILLFYSSRQRATKIPAFKKQTKTPPLKNKKQNPKMAILEANQGNNYVETATSCDQILYREALFLISYKTLLKQHLCCQAQEAYTVAEIHSLPN